MEEFDNIQPLLDQEDGSQIDFQKYLKGVWKRKWIIVLLTIIVSVPFYWNALNQVPIYRARVLLQVRDLEMNDGPFWNDERLGEVNSRAFRIRLASRLGMAIVLEDKSIKNYDKVFNQYSTSNSPQMGRYEIAINETGAYNLVFQDSLGTSIVDSANVWDLVAASRSVNGITFQLQPDVVELPKSIRFKVIGMDMAVRELTRELKVSTYKKGTIMQLQMEGADPEALPYRLNRIAAGYVEESLRLKSRGVNTKQDVYEKQLAAAEAKVNQIEAQLRSFTSKYPFSLDREEQRLLDKLTEYDRAVDELPRIRTQLSDYLDRLNKSDQEPDPEQYRRFVINEILNNEIFANETKMALLRQQLQTEQSQYARLLDQYSPSHPEIADIKEKITDTQEEIIEFTSNYRNTLAKRESRYRTEREAIQAQLQSLPADRYRYMELERKKKINEELYSYLFQELQKIDISNAVEESEIQILDPAIKPSRPINPSKMSRVLLGGGLGMLLGIILSILLEVLDNKIRTFNDVEKQLRLPVLGAIPIVKFKDIDDFEDFEKAKQIDRQLVTHDYSPTPIGESYRALRTHLMFSKQTGRIHTLLITSISPEEGKSFTASNLAIILAQQRTNTLLVDADLRRGVLHNTFGMNKEPGFTNYLNNRVALSSVVQQTHVPNLSIISCGSMIPNPSELLGSPQMKRFLDEARRKFDFILFDAPPLEAATDGVVIGTQVDAVAVVVKSGQTNRKVAQEKLEVFNNVNVNVIGVVLNGTENALVNDTYSYYHY